LSPKSTACLSSHFNLTNHHKGSQFIVYFVPFLSVKIFLANGGIQTQNSSTFTQKNLAAKKCQSS